MHKGVLSLFPDADYECFWAGRAVNEQSQVVFKISSWKLRLGLFLCLRWNKHSKVFGNKPKYILYCRAWKKIKFKIQFL
jgi:hypothetical protein